MYRFQAAIAPLESILSCLILLYSLLKPVNLARIGNSGRVLLRTYQMACRRVFLAVEWRVGGLFWLFDGL